MIDTIALAALSLLTAHLVTIGLYFRRQLHPPVGSDFIGQPPVTLLRPVCGREAFDRETVDELRQRARNKLLADAITREENLRKADEPLLSLEGMDNDLASQLVGHGVKTLDDLGELATDDLVEMTGIDEERASSLIMKAREHWFE